MCVNKAFGHNFTFLAGRYQGGKNVAGKTFVSINVFEHSWRQGEIQSWKVCV